LSPSPLLKRAFRAPVFLYDIGAGWLYGHRFLLLTHRGRRSGRVYRTMLEVVGWDAARREAVVMSGFGPRSNWYLNVLAGNAGEIRIGRLRFRPEARALDPDEATRVVAAYERRNRVLSPVVRAILSRLGGFPYDGSDASRRELVERLPLVSFRPLPPVPPGDSVSDL
jgi:deazaflavin-dependent oxidoreductase (nitroreductase family)